MSLCTANTTALLGIDDLNIFSKETLKGVAIIIGSKRRKELAYSFLAKALPHLALQIQIHREQQGNVLRKGILQR